MRRFSLLLLLAACGEATPVPIPVADGVRDSTHRVHAIEGFSGPEAVRFDPAGDQWFVANFNGDPAGDANGFISRVSVDGVIDSLRFMVGTAAAPLHGPRGMFLQGDTLWVADAQGVHGFHRATGAQVRFHDLSSHGPGFLNDVAVGPDGAIYVTDTGTSRIFRLAGDTVTVALGADRGIGPLNGITLAAESGRFLIAGWEDGGMVRAWDPATGAVSDVGMAKTGRFDGIERLGDRIIVASQSDSSLHAITNGAEQIVIRTPGAPADIGVDERRNRVAVPYIRLNRVDIWELPR